MLKQIQYYLSGQASSVSKYFFEQLILGLTSWIPTVIGVGIRSIAYRLIMNLEGTAAIESKVRIAFADHITLGNGVYLDRDVYLHALPSGITIGDNTFLMHHTMLHVFNFRKLVNVRFPPAVNPGYADP